MIQTEPTPDKIPGSFYFDFPIHLRAVIRVLFVYVYLYMSCICGLPDPMTDHLLVLELQQAEDIYTTQLGRGGLVPKAAEVVVGE